MDTRSYFTPSGKSKIIWTKVDDTSDFDYPGTRVHYIEHFQVSGKLDKNNTKIDTRCNLYPYVGVRPTYKQVKLIFNLTDCKESMEYLEENEHKHAAYVVDDLAMKYYLKKLGRKKCLELGWYYGISAKLRSGIKYDKLT